MQQLLNLISYQSWATIRTLEAVQQLTQAQYVHVIPSSFPSVHSTLVHGFGADRAWLGRVQSHTVARANPDDYNLESLQTEWLKVLDAWTIQLSLEQDANRIISYQSFDSQHFQNSLTQIVQHVINHGTYHRGQITTLLRQLGVQPISTDMIGYFRKQI